jgi:hypothetical protein
MDFGESSRQRRFGFRVVHDESTIPDVLTTTWQHWRHEFEQLCRRLKVSATTTLYRTGELPLDSNIIDRQAPWIVDPDLIQPDSASVWLRIPWRLHRAPGDDDAVNRDPALHRGRPVHGQQLPASE